MDGEYWQTQGQWEQYFYEEELTKKGDENGDTQETNGGADSATKHEAGEDRGQQVCGLYIF